MRLLKLMTLVVMILTVYDVAAQNPKRANIWYFGMNAGLDFTNGNPVPLTNGAMQASEGITVASDVSGNLQFYSNGGDVPNTGAIWNRNHQVMPNGLLGHTGCGSSIQSSIAVNMPGNPNIYYLFTTDCYENGFENGLKYSIIDMTLDGGLGDVVEKGTLLTRNTTESLTAVANANQKDYWIVTHKVNTDSFYVYQFTSKGIKGVVKSKVGPWVNETAGEIKVSANGERLVFGANQTFTGLFDFDAATGQVSNYRNLGVANGFTACFSPDCDFLYVASFLAQKVYQFDLIAYNVASSKIEIAAPSNYIGSMQMGPDDKIYCAMRSSQYLGVITQPKVRGVNCNFVENGQYLGGNLSKYGLPNFPNNTLGECFSYPVENLSKYDFPIQPEHLQKKNVVLRWNNYPGANAYRVDYRRADENEWQTVTAESNTQNIEGLEQNTEYEFRMDKILFENGEYDFIYDHDFNNVVAGTNDENNASLKVKTTDGFSFNLYPVPAKENVTVEINFEQATDVEIDITDLSGKTVYRQKLVNLDGSQRLEIPTLQLPNGSYHLSVRSNGRNENKQLIVMN